MGETKYTLCHATLYQQELYDREYSRLPLQFKGFENWRLSHIQRIFHALDVRPGDRFLDIGVGGTGYTVLAAAQAGARAVGVDISTVACRTACRYREQLGIGDRAMFLCCSATALPFADHSFDKIVCNAVLEHLQDDDKAIDEICRVSTFEARVLVCVPNTYLAMSYPLALLNVYNDHRVGHLRHYAASDIALRFQRRGFQVRDVTYHGHFIKVVQLLLAMLLPPVRRSTSRLWWALEHRDLTLKHDPSSVNVSVTLERTV